MNGIGGIEDFLKEFTSWYQGFLDGLMELPWNDAESPLFKEREKQGARILGATPLGLPYEILGPGGAEAYDRGKWKPLNQKEAEFADYINALREKHGVKGGPIIHIIGLYGCEHGEDIVWYPQYDVFTNTIQLRAGEHTVLNIQTFYERAPFLGLSSDGKPYVEVGYWPSPVLTGKRKDPNNFWLGLESQDYLILIERDSKEAIFERLNKDAKEKPLLEFSVSYGKNRWHPSPLAVPSDSLDGRLTAFLSNLDEGEQTHAYDKLIRI